MFSGPHCIPTYAEHPRCWKHKHESFFLILLSFSGNFRPFRTTDSHLHWMSFFSNPFNAQNHLSWVGWYLQKNQWDSLQEIMKGWCSSMWNPPVKNGKPLWRDVQEWKPPALWMRNTTIEKIDHEIPPFKSRSNMIFHADPNQKTWKGLVMKTWKNTFWDEVLVTTIYMYTYIFLGITRIYSTSKVLIWTKQRDLLLCPHFTFFFEERAVFNPNPQDPT